MKLLVIAACIFFNSAPSHLMVLDKNLKKPIRAANEFSIQDYMHRNFPIYATDKEAIIMAADQAAKWIEQVQPCYTADSIQTPNSFFVVVTDCEEGMAYSVRLFTRVAENATVYSFTLVENEPSKRKAQQRLMDFATYINQ
jgi:hypothetical protein